MADQERLQAWMEGYVRAWNSNDPADISSLFADDATYRTEPYAAPWRGTSEIVSQWLKIKDEPGDADFAWEPLVVTPDVAVVTGQATYRSPARVYSNLWVIRLDDEGRCREFTEWWMKHGD